MKSISILLLLSSLTVCSFAAEKKSQKRKFTPKINSNKVLAFGNNETPAAKVVVVPKEAEAESFSLSHWIKKISEADSNYHLVTHRKPPTPLIAQSQQATFDRMTKLLKGYILSKTTVLQRKVLWLEKNNGWQENLDLFQPFAERKLLNLDSQNFFFGDFHGDIKSFAKELQHLKDLGLIDDNFKLAEHVNLFFLGDYTDRGCYGCEVIFTVLKLFFHNKSQVHFVRGNHEDVGMNDVGGFSGELMYKLPREKFIEFRKTLTRFYNLMPVVFYVGRGTDWIQVCHGGLEPGYDPKPLLSAAGVKRYDLIFPLDRKGFFKNFNQENGFESLLDCSMNGTKRVIKLNTMPVNAIQSFHSSCGNTGGITLGFQWADFVYNPLLSNKFVDQRGFAYGKGFTQKSLELMEVRAIIRAHQHGYKDVMNHLRTHGLFRFWQKDLATAETIPVTQGDVFMFNVGADTSYWWSQGSPWGCSKTATFGELRVAESFADWRMTRHQVEIKL